MKVNDFLLSKTPMAFRGGYAGRVQRPCLDILRAALTLVDQPLADHHAEQLMASHEAKKAFGKARQLYALHGREVDFRNIQKQVALKRIHHAPPAS